MATRRGCRVPRRSGRRCRTPARGGSSTSASILGTYPVSFRGGDTLPADFVSAWATCRTLGSHLARASRQSSGVRGLIFAPPPRRGASPWLADQRLGGGSMKRGRRSVLALGLAALTSGCVPEVDRAHPVIMDVLMLVVG